MKDRAVSVALSYVLTLAIATLLISGLLYATGGLVDDRRESATRAELRVVGEQIASDLMAADRLAQTGADTIRIKSASPSTIAGSQYSVSVNGTRQEITLETRKPDVTVRVPIENKTHIADSETRGGVVKIVLVSDELEVQSE